MKNNSKQSQKNKELQVTKTKTLKCPLAHTILWHCLHELIFGNLSIIYERKIFLINILRKNSREYCDFEIIFIKVFPMFLWTFFFPFFIIFDIFSCPLLNIMLRRFPQISRLYWLQVITFSKPFGGLLGTRFFKLSKS